MVDPPYKDVASKVWGVSKKVEGVTKKVGGSGPPDPPSGCALGLDRIYRHVLYQFISL